MFIKILKNLNKKFVKLVTFKTVPTKLVLSKIMARRKDLGGMDDLGGLDAVERMLYGNVEDDLDLLAELKALEGEIDEEDDEEIEPTPVNRRPAPSTTRKTTGAGPHRPQTSNLGSLSVYF